MRPDCPVARIGYLVGEFPLTHAHYLARELSGLRHGGLQVHVVAVRSGDVPDATVAQECTYLLPVSIASYARAHASCLAERPIRYLRTLLCATAVPRWDLKAMLMSLAHFAEAVVAERHFRAMRVEHVHVHFASSVALHLARLGDVPVSVALHGPEEFDDPVGFRLREKVQAAAWVRTISEYGGSQVRRWVPVEQWEKVRVVQLGIDPGEEPPPRQQLRRPVRLLFAGRLAAVKGLPILLRAVAGVRSASTCPFELWLVGGGTERAGLERQVLELGIADVVRFLGPLPNQRLREVMRDTDVFVMSSFAEGLPVVLMEAMASEMACVVPWVAGIPELVEPDRSGVLVPAGSEPSLRAALVRLIENAGLRARLGAAARDRVVRLHDADTQVAHLMEAICTP